MEDLQPIVLYRDAESRCVRAAAFPGKLDLFPDELMFRGGRFVYAGQGVIFWDYLTQSDSGLVGVVLNDFELDAPLRQSPLLAQSTNVRADGTYGFEILLASPQGELTNDGTQAFGSALYQCGGDVLLLLDDWHRRGYGFPIDSHVIELA